MSSKISEELHALFSKNVDLYLPSKEKIWKK